MCLFKKIAFDSPFIGRRMLPEADAIGNLLPEACHRIIAYPEYLFSLTIFLTVAGYDIVINGTCIEPLEDTIRQDKAPFFQRSVEKRITTPIIHKNSELIVFGHIDRPEPKC